MIVCRECGTENADDDQFCGGCPAFLEWTGERVDDGRPVEDDDVDDDADRAGLVTRIKHAITGDDLPPPEGTHTLAPPTGDPALGPPDASTDHDAGRDADHSDDRAAALVARTPQDAVERIDGKRTEKDNATGARTPEAQLPKAAKVRPKVKRQPPSRKINPGDLICGQCGEGNDPERKYCRRCGNSLVEAVVAKRPWYKRWLPSKQNKKEMAAGERPSGRGSTGRRGTGESARLAKGKALGRWADARRILAILAVVGIGAGFVLPSARTWIFDTAESGYSRVRRVVSPTYTNIPVDPDRITASSDRPDGPAEAVADGNTLTYWVAQRPDRDPSVTVTFVEPTDVAHVLIHPGQQEDGGKVVRPDPRPREVLFRVIDESGTVTEVDASVEDEDGFQTIDIGIDDVASVETVVVNCFPDPVVIVCPITELEFQSKD